MINVGEGGGVVGNGQNVVNFGQKLVIFGQGSSRVWRGDISVGGCSIGVVIGGDRRCRRGRGGRDIRGDEDI